MRVLYVDDEAGLLEVGKLFLEKEGEFSVDIVQSASAALEMLKKNTFDAIISDYQMPEMDGIAFLKEIRSRFDNIPFILFTGRGREEVVIEAINNGADFYLQKGGDPTAQFAELAHKIRLAVQQRRAEISIRDHERREADIINFLPDATFAIDTHGVVIAWNRAMEAMTGVSAAEILGKGNYEYAIPFYHERRPILVDLVLKDDPATEAKYPYVTRSGDKLFSEITIPILNNRAESALWFTASPLYDTSGRVIGSIESIRDVTERKRAEEALRESEDRLISIFGAAQVGIILVDAVTHQILQANAKALDLFGATEQDVVGRTCHTFICPAEEGRCPVTDLLEAVDSSERVILARGKKKIPVLKTVVRRRIGGRDVLIESFVDITDRKRMEEALAESERRYRGVVETQTEFVCRFLPDGTHVFVNDAYCRYFGKTRNEIIGHRFRPEIPAEDQDAVRQHFASLTRDHPVAQTEHRIILPDGTVRWQWWSDHAIFDESGRVVEYQTTGKDITTRKQAEEALREREATLASIFRAAPTGIGLVVNRVIMKVNDRLCGMTGYTAAELLGRSARVLYPSDEDYEYVGREKYEQISKSGTGTVETRWLRKDGTIRDVLLSSTPLDPSDREKGVTFTALDITESKEAEQALRQGEELVRGIIEKNPLSIQIVDKDGFTLRVNPAHTRLFGAVPPPDFSIFVDLINKHPEFEKCISRVKSGESVQLPDIRFNVRDTYPDYPDVPVWVRAIIFPLDHNGGKTERYVLMHENITEQKQAEEALHESRRFLEEIIENVPARVFWKDTRLTYLGCNTAFARDAGFEKPEEIIGKDDYSMGWRDQAGLYRADDRFVIGSGKAKLLIEEPQTKPSGEQISILTSKVPLRDAAGKTIGVLGTYLDVTERNRAAEELKASEVSYRGLFNTIRQALYILDREGKFVDVNAGAENMYGYAREEFIGRTPEFLSAPGKNELPAVAEMIQKAFSGEPQQFEFWGLRKNGEVFPKDVSLYKGTYFGEDIVLAVGIDITERRKAENALRESENKFATVFRSNPVTLTLVSATDGRFVDVNDAFVANTGYGREEVIGRTSEELGIFADAREYEQLVSRLRGGQQAKGIELHIRKKDGDVRSCQFTSGIILMQGRPHILSSVEDIADRKNAELAFQAMTLGMVGTTGIGSLDRITESIGSWLGADCIMIGEIQPDRKHVNVLSMLLDGKKVEDYSYSLKGTPCDNTAEKGFCLHPDNVASIFPESRDLRELNIRGYAGTPLRSADGRVIGILCILTRKPLILPPEGRRILDIMAVKAAAGIEHRQGEERLTRINEALLHLGMDHLKNIDSLTRLCGEMLDADCVLYNRLDSGLLCVIGKWNCPPDLPARDMPEGHICFDVIREDRDGPLVVRDLLSSQYAQTDPNVAAYGLKTYIGHPVRYGNISRGSLCALYTRDFTPTVEDLKTIGILSSAVAQEEERREADQALRESEEKYRALFDSAGDAIFIHDLNGKILASNTRACEMLGYTSRDLLSMTVGEVDSPQNALRAPERIARMKEQGHISFETAHRRRDGSLIPVAVSAKLVTWEGQPAAMSICHDISDRKRAEEALLQVNRKLNLLSGITRHDIKNQLLTLNGFLEISKKYSGNAAKMSEFIGKEGKVVKTMERQIAFTKDYEAIGVNAPVWQDCRTLVDTAAKQFLLGNTMVKNDLPAGLVIFADPLIVKVCYNLMDNALRHGGKITTIRFFAEQRDGDHMVVCEDDGAGVPAGEKEQIFERGFGKNTGMGLFLAREILSITGITITETGKAVEGARFEITVPKEAWRNAGERVN